MNCCWNCCWNEQPDSDSRDSSSVHTEEETFPVLALPVALLHQVLGRLGPQDLVQLLRTSKAMAKEVMNHRPGRLTLKLKVQRGIHQAAVKHLLQWAPPACLKLMLDGVKRDRSMPFLDWTVAQGLFGATETACPAPGSHAGHLLACILEVSIKGFVLPSLVPADVAAACPNLGLVDLQDCVLYDSQQQCMQCDNQQHQTGSSKGRSRGHENSNSTSSGSSSTTCRGAPKNLHTLSVGYISAGLQQDLPIHSMWGTPSTPTACFLEQLWASVPSVRCLILSEAFNPPCVDFIWKMLGPQLTELRAPSKLSIKDSPLGAGAQLHQLQKLVLPCLDILHSPEIELLLSLPKLTHLELRALILLDKEYSSHACTWQYLQLHLPKDHSRLRLDLLAKLPLHSLTQPLTLGSHPSVHMHVELPSTRNSQCLALLQRMALQLTKCGVKLLTPDWSWKACEGDPIWTKTPGAEVVPALEVMAPLFGPQAAVQLSYMCVDHAILQAVATAYQKSLRKLTLRSCDFDENMEPAWHAVLSGCPTLTEVDHQSSSPHWFEEFVGIAKGLIAAVARQPAGRCIDVTTNSRCEGTTTIFGGPQEQLKLVEEGAKDYLAGVEQLIAERCGLNGSCTCFPLKSKGSLHAG